MALVAYFCLFLYYCKPKKFGNVVYGVSIYIILRTGIRLCDFENTRPFGDETEWFFRLVYQTGNLFVHTTVFFMCSPATRLHIFVTMVVLTFETLTVMCGIWTSKLLIEDPIYFFEKATVPILLFCFSFSIYMYFVLKVSNGFIDRIHEKLESKEEYKFILDRLEHSIIIIQNGQIEFVNDLFLSQFQGLINLYQRK